MSAPVLLSALLVAWCVAATAAAADQPSAADPHGDRDADLGPTKKLQLHNGFFLEVPKDKNATGKLLSFGVDFNKSPEEGRSKRKKLMSRILPLFIMPFIVQSTLVPMVLGLLKFMLFKSMMVGKLALTLIILNAFRNHNSFKGRKDEVVANVHYGYQGDGMNEYGAYFNS